MAHAPVVMSYLYKRDGNCLLCAVSYCMYNTEDRHCKIRLSTVMKIISEWEYYKVLSWTHQWYGAEDYKNLLFRDGEHRASIPSTNICFLL